MMVLEIIKLVLTVILLFVLVTVFNRFIKVLNSKYILQRDMETRSIKYSEEEILGHLNYIIEEALDQYVIMNIKPKGIYYISNSMENELNEVLAESIPARISPTLYSQLQLIYNPEIIGTVIGEKIYMNVLSYVLNFNINNEQEQKNKK